jgi:hypothetical protein
VVETIIYDVRVLSGRRRTPQGERERAEKGPFQSLVFRLSCSLLPLDDSPTASRCNLCHSEHLDVLWCCLTSFLTTLPHAQATKPPKLAASSRDQNWEMRGAGIHR